MKKRITRYTVIIMALVIAIALVVSPVSAALDIRSIEYNFDAQASEWALVVERAGGKPAIHWAAGEFILKGSIKTVVQLEQSITDSINDFMFIKEPLSQYPTNDPIRQDPAILAPGQTIVGNQLYSTGQYFAIHIYTLDDPETPESELRFLTRFQSAQAGTIPVNWWQ